MDLGWRRCQPAPGQPPYYFNVLFGTTQWALPAGLTDSDVQDFSEADEASVNDSDLVPVHDFAPSSTHDVRRDDCTEASSRAALSSDLPLAPTAEPVDLVHAVTAAVDASILADFPDLPREFFASFSFPPLPLVHSRGVGGPAYPIDLAWEPRYMPSSGHELGERYFINSLTGAQAWDLPPVLVEVSEARDAVRRRMRQQSTLRDALESLVALDDSAMTNPLDIHAAVLEGHNLLAELSAECPEAFEDIQSPQIVSFFLRKMHPSVHPATARLAARVLHMYALHAPAVFLACTTRAQAPEKQQNVSPAAMIYSCCAGLVSSLDTAQRCDWMALLAIAALRFSECCGAAAVTDPGLEVLSIASCISSSLADDAFAWMSVAKFILARSHAAGPVALATGVAALASLHRLFEVCHISASDDTDASRERAASCDFSALSDSLGIITPLVEAIVQRGVIRVSEDTPGESSSISDGSPARAARGATSAALSSALVNALTDPSAVLSSPRLELVDDGTAVYSLLMEEPALLKTSERGGRSGSAILLSSCLASDLSRRLVIAELSLLRAMLELASVLHDTAMAAPVLMVNDLKCLIDIVLREVTDLPVSDTIRAVWLLALRTLLLKSQWFDPGGCSRYRAVDIAALLNSLYGAGAHTAGLPPTVRAVTEDILCGEARTVLED